MPKFYLAGLAIVALAGCPSAHTNSTGVKARGDTIPSTTLGPGDVIDVRVYNEPDLSATYQVGSDGSIQFPLIGRIEIARKSPAEAANAISDKLKTGYLRDPQVSIFVKEYNSKRIYVMGQVEKPGVFAYEDDMNILRAIILAGGPTKLAAKSKVLLTRKTAEGESQIEVSIEDVGRGQAENIPLKPGDIIFVPESIF